MSNEWATAGEFIKKAQSKQKRQYDKKSSESKLQANDHVMVRFPSVVQGKAWKFARLYFGPYKILSPTSTNAEVDRSNEDTLFVALDRIRPCYEEKGDDVRVGRGLKKRSKTKATSVKTAVSLSLEYSGPITRARACKP